MKVIKPTSLKESALKLIYVFNPADYTWVSFDNFDCYYSFPLSKTLRSSQRPAAVKVVKDRAVVKDRERQRTLSSRKRNLSRWLFVRILVCVNKKENFALWNQYQMCIFEVIPWYISIQTIVLSSTFTLSPNKDSAVLKVITVKGFLFQFTWAV